MMMMMMVSVSAHTRCSTSLTHTSTCRAGDVRGALLPARADPADRRSDQPPQTRQSGREKLFFAPPARFSGEFLSFLQNLCGSAAGDPNQNSSDLNAKRLE